MRTLLLIDLQRDFCPGGALAVPEGNAVVPIVNALMMRFEHVVATQDWHPANHSSFAANHLWRKPGQVIEINGLEQVLWPIHCVQESFGASFHPDVHTEGIDRTFVKGTDPMIDSYSGFFDNGHRKDTGLGTYLKAQGTTAVYIAGLATDYCVKYSALDAVQLGFDTFVVQDACRGVNLEAGDDARAFEEMAARGVQLITSSELLTT